MSQPPRAPHPAIAAFNRRLSQTYETAGPPGPKRLQEISQELPGPVELVKSTLHDNLRRTRLTLPPWNWVAMLVRSLRVAAQENDLDPDQLIGTVDAWRQRYINAKTASKQPPSPEPPLAAPVLHQAAVADAAGLSADGSIPVMPPVGGDLGGAGPMDVPGFLSWSPEPSAHEDLPVAAGDLVESGTDQPYADRTHLVTLFSDHISDLLEAARQGDIDASARLGVLLLCRGADRDLALSQLDDAACAGEVMALSLLAANATVRRELAAAYALELAQQTDGPAAGLYFEAAADAGNPGAAFRLGRLKEAQGQIHEARRWYEMAAHADFLDVTMSRPPEPPEEDPAHK